MSEEDQVHRGSCLCGNVQYETTGPLRNVIACHCTQCRKTTGHFLAGTSVNKSNLRMVKESTLCWYQSSPGHQRGFCGNCGSSLFWQAENQDGISILAGTLDGPTGIQLKMHIFTNDKGDYYKLSDDLPQYSEDILDAIWTSKTNAKTNKE